MLARAEFVGSRRDEGDVGRYRPPACSVETTVDVRGRVATRTRTAGLFVTIDSVADHDRFEFEELMITICELAELVL